MSTALVPPRARAVAAPLGVAVVAAATWLAVGMAQPGDDGRVLCPWRAVTGLDCPFCGATRAMATLALGDLGAALDHNAFLVLVVLPLAALGWIAWLAARLRGTRLDLSSRWVYGLLLLTGAWWALRVLVPWLGSGSS